MRAPQRKRRVRARTVVLLLSALALAITALAWRAHAPAPPPPTHTDTRPAPPEKPQRVVLRGEDVALRVSRAPVGATGVPYACATLDFWPDAKSDWGRHTWNGSTVTTLGLLDQSPIAAQLGDALRHLQPAALRVGGSLQDLVSYDAPGDGRRAPFAGCPAFKARPEDRIAFEGGCLPLELYDALDDLALKAGAPLVFGLSGLHGRTRVPGGCAKAEKCGGKKGEPCPPCWTGAWSPTAGGARALLRRARNRADEGRSALAAVSLGNELCGAGGIAAHLTPEDVAADFRALDGELDAIWFPRPADAFPRLALPPSRGRPLLVGPDCQLPLDLLPDFLSRFLDAAGGALDAAAYHLYWLGSGEHVSRAKKKMLDLQIHDETKSYPFRRAFYATTKLYAKVARGRPLWVTEAGGLYGSGGPRASSTFGSAFWYLDELGSLAKRSTQLHCRQALVGGHYGLLERVGDALVPRPDYFLTRLWASLMGSLAFAADVDAVDDDRPTHVVPERERARDFRAYAHCRLGRPADLVVAFVNAASKRARRVRLPKPLAAVSRDEFHLTAPPTPDGGFDVWGDVVLLNGAALRDAGQPLAPVAASGGLVLAPASYAFVVFRDARWPECRFNGTR